MKFRVKPVLLALCLVFISATYAFAAAKTFTVLPFTVNGPEGYKYLEKSIPAMFVSRLHWEGNFVETGQESAIAKKAVASEAEAEKLRSALNADYVIWGSVTIVGEDASLDVRVSDKAGKTWPKAKETRVAQLIPALKGVSDAINADVFKRPQEKVAVQPVKEQPVNRMNPELVYNEDGKRKTYLNPNFRYSGGSEGGESMLRTQQLPYFSTSMEVCDADGDGVKEIFIAGEHEIYAYHLENSKLVQIGLHKIPLVDKPLSMRSIDMDRSGRLKLIVNAISADNTPSTSVLTFDGKQFTVEANNISYYLNVLRMPPDYMPVLLGQASEESRLFIPGVYEMGKVGGRYTAGMRLSLPDGANVFNFVYLPGGRDENDSDKFLMLSMLERLRVYTRKGSRLAETDEHYSGSSRGVDVFNSMPGMGKNVSELEDIYYIPLRMIPLDLEKDGNYELIINHPISTASEVFPRYRSFPQSEIHSLYWDGSGMNLQWKTKRIKATVVDYTVDDIDGDGITDLVVCVNTHPGSLGFKSIRTMLFIYPLDLSQMSKDAVED